MVIVLVHMKYLPPGRYKGTYNMSLGFPTYTLVVTCRISSPRTARRSILWVSTREPRKSRVVFSVCSRARYTRNPSLDIYLLAVFEILESKLLSHTFVLHSDKKSPKKESEEPKNSSKLSTQGPRSWGRPGPRSWSPSQDCLAGYGQRPWEP